MPKPYCITFAGVPGTSKSIIAHYLSERFGLPIFNTDNIRFEVREDMLASDIHAPGVLDEYEKRVAKRRGRMLKQRRSFILDGSVDRTWMELKQEVEHAGYLYFIIDMELSPAFIENLFLKTGRTNALDELMIYLGQHETFMAAYAYEVGLQITDETFAQRTTLAEAAVRSFIGDKTP